MSFSPSRPRSAEATTSDGPLILVNGLPGSGKTTLARPLAALLNTPYIGKDLIKEAIGDVLGPVDLASSRKIGHAAITVMYALAAASPHGLLDSLWHPPSKGELTALERPFIEVFCACPPHIALERCRARLADRHPVHCDAERLTTPIPPWRDATPLDLGPVLVVDTTMPASLQEVATWVRAQDAWRAVAS